MNKPTIPLGTIANAVNGRLQGDAEKEIGNVAPFFTASDTDIVFAGGKKFLGRLKETKAGAVIVPNYFQGDRENLIFVDHPHIAFNQVVRLFYPEETRADRISERAVIGKDFQCGEDVTVGPQVAIGDHVRLGNRVTVKPGVVIGDHVTIGDDVMLYPHVTILDGCVIGSQVIVHAGTVIGSDGFGFVPHEDKYHKIPHVGVVRIGDDVEIGALNAIDRGTIDDTVIKNGVRTDNLVHIAHNVSVGEKSVLVAQVGIAGSTTIGNHVVLAGQTGVVGHITIGDHTIVGPKSGILKSTPGGEIISGIPTMPHKDWLKSCSITARLPEMKKKIAHLEKRLAVLEDEQRKDSTS